MISNESFCVATSERLFCLKLILLRRMGICFGFFLILGRFESTNAKAHLMTEKHLCTTGRFLQIETEVMKC